MQGHDDLLKALAIVLGVGALASIASQRLRQPIVLGYILAGLLVGPYVPLPLVADPLLVHTLSEIGVILLMFSLGLEFSVRQLVRAGPRVSGTAIVQCSALIWLGFAAGRLLGWTTYESLFTGAIVAISSTTIIAKAFDEQGIQGKLRQLVVGVLIVEDLIAILLMTMLTTIATGAGLSPASLGRMAAGLGAFLVAVVVIGFMVIPRGIRAISSLNRPEVTTVASVALCFSLALLARALGYSVALGAFLAGSIIAESGEEKKIERLVQPLRDVFGAVFFVSVGMMINPLLIARHWLPVIILTLVVVVGKIVSVTLGAFLTGHGVRTSVQAGMSLAQIGEFSFIIAGLGLTLRATGDFIFPVAVAVSSITTLLTPWLIRASGPVAAWVDSKLPRSLQTFTALYGSWLERIRAGGRKADHERASHVRRFVRMLAIDAVALFAIFLAAVFGAQTVIAYLMDKTGLTAQLARGLFAVGVGAAVVPFMVGLVRVSRRLARQLADMALPPPATDGLDLAVAPRRALVVTLQIALLLVVGAPLVAITQPFLRSFRGAELLLLGLVVLAFTLWRTAANLQGHVRASAQILAEHLARHAERDAPAETPAPLSALLEGLGEPVSFALPPESPATGKTLGELNLRGLTGAIVLAITRAESAVVVPTASERLRAGDVIVVAGTHEAADAARVLLGGAAAATP